MKSSHDRQKGFSLFELLVVLIMVAIFVAISVITLASTRKYNADDQALEIVDILNQARQGALNQRRTFRVEINKTKNQIALINESDKFNDASDDEIVKSAAFRK